MVYQEIVDNILQLEKSKPEDYWRDNAVAPLFSRKIFDEYEEGKIPDEDVITLPVDTRDAQSRTPFNCLVCASTGVGKDRLIKNIIKAYFKQGYKILIIEPKGYEMLN